MENSDLIDLSDYAWQRLIGRLDGMEDAEYLWEPAPGSWSIRPGADGAWRLDGAVPAPDPAPLTTIAWRLHHIADGVLAAERNATWLGLAIAAPVVGAPAATVAEVRPRLEASYSFWRQCLDGAGDLSAPVGPVAGHYADATRRSFVLHELDELIHHSAEVALLLDLYRAAPSITRR
ncbi:MAG TPA: DinB family protein [Mycobacteriales bacterium]|nr:DinB family protein [Mycobacteriales bacterium]